MKATMPKTFVCCLIILLFTGCNINNSVITSEPSPAVSIAPENISNFDYSSTNITYIEITEGSSSVNSNYCIHNEVNNIYINLTKFNCGKTTEAKINITQDNFDEIVSILQKHQVHKWN